MNIVKLFKRQPPAPTYSTSRPYPSPPMGRRTRVVPDVIGRYSLPLSVLQYTDGVMREFGTQNRECYVWWSGYFTPSGDGQILTALCPQIRTSFGHIHLGRRELGVLQNRIRELDQVLLVELHSHPPGAGGQNDMDGAHPAATYRGFISIVVPDFGMPQFYDLRKSFIYEYQSGYRWRRLTADEIQDRFIIEEPFISVKL